MNEYEKKAAELRRRADYESVAYCLWYDLKASGMLKEQFEKWDDPSILPEAAQLLDGRLQAFVPLMIREALLKLTLAEPRGEECPDLMPPPVIPDVFFGKADRLARGRPLANMLNGDSNCFILDGGTVTVVATCLAEPGFAAGDHVILGREPVATGKDESWMAMGDDAQNPKAYDGGCVIEATASHFTRPRERGTFRFMEKPVYAIWMAHRPAEAGERVTLLTKTHSRETFAVPTT